MKRCQWGTDDPIYLRYHDQEWGMPVFDERKLFEFLLLEGMQAGLSWITILKKRAHYRKVCDRFNPNKMAYYDKRKIESLLQDPGIIRNRLKVAAMVTNAQAYLDLREKAGDFRDFVWQFVDGEPRVNRFRSIKAVPAFTPQSDAMSNALKQRGFKFVGSTICYAYMQAVGMVNDHMVDCFRHKECLLSNICAG